MFVPQAFHAESLYVIARFNERRCRGMPLYGQDLVEALTVVDSGRPVRSGLLRPGRRHCGGAGHVSTLCSTEVRQQQQLPRRQDPHRHRYSTRSLAHLMERVAHNCKIHSERLLAVELPPTILLAAGFNPVLKDR